MNYFILNKELKTVAIAQTDSSSRNAFHVLEDTFVEYSNAPSTLELTLDFYNEKALEVKEGAHVVFKYDDVHRLFQIKQIEEQHASDSYVKVYAEESSFELLDAVVFAKDYVSPSAEYLLGIALADTDWEVGEVSPVSLETYSFSAYDTALSQVQQIATDTECMLTFRVNFSPQKGVTGKFVDLIEKVTVDEGKRLEFGRNVDSIKRTVDRTTICTAVIPVGANDTLISGFDWVNHYEDKTISKNKDLYYLEVDEATRSAINPNSDHHLFYVLKEDAEDKSTLCQKAYEYLKDHKEPQYTYDVSAIFLNTENYKIGEQVRIIDDELGVSMIADVVEKSISFCKPDGNSITLTNYTERASSISQVLYNIQNKLQSSVLDNPLIITSPTAPEDGYNEGTIWIDTSNTSKGEIIINQYFEGTWIPTLDTEKTESIIDGRMEMFEDQITQKIDGIEVLKGTTLPTTAIAGQLFINTNTGDMYQYLNGKWVQMTDISGINSAISNIQSAQSEMADVQADLQQKASDLEDLADELEGKTDELETKANELITKADELEAKAEELTTATNNLETRIDETEESITLMATKTEVQDAVDNLEVGGRNLLRNSNFMNGIYYWMPVNVNAGVVDSGTNQFTKAIVVTQDVIGSSNERVYNDTNYFSHTPNQTYSLQFWAKSDTNAVLRATVGGQYLIDEFNLTSEWKQFTATYTINAGGSLTFWLTEAGKFYLGNVKLEKGTKHTDYTTAPEDTDNAINTLDTKITSNTSSITLLNNQIALKVEQTDVEETVNNAIDGIEVGGRNFLRFTGDEWTATATYDTGSDLWNYNSIIRMYSTTPYQMQLNEVLTFSCDYELDWTNCASGIPTDIGGDVNTAAVGMGIGRGEVAGTYNADISMVADFSKYGNGYEKGKFVYTFTVKEKDAGTYFAFRPIRSYNYDIRGVVLTLKNIQLEKGNLNTQWQPNPLDLETEVDTLTTRISNAETSINQNAEEIELRATKTEVTTIKNTVDETLANLQIGGRNLALGTGTPKVIAESTSQNYGSSYSLSPVIKDDARQFLLDIKDKALLLSYDINFPENTRNESLTLNRVGVYFQFNFADANGSYTYWYGTHANAEQHPTNKHTLGNTFKDSLQSITTNGLSLVGHYSCYIYPKDIPFIQNFYNNPDLYPTVTASVVTINVMGNTKGGTVSNLMLEVGTVQSEWSPAPEDIETEVDNLTTTVTQNTASINVLNSEIALKVDQSTYTTDKNNMQSQITSNSSAITQNAKEIALKVEQTDIDNALNNLEIGGTNLIRHTKDFKVTNSGATGWNNGSGVYSFARDSQGFMVASKSQTGQTSNTIPSLYSSYFPVEVGDVVTLSCMFMVDDVTAWDGIQAPYIFEVMYADGSSRPQYQDVAITSNNCNKPTVESGKWVHFYSTHTINYEGNCRMRLSLFRNGSIHFKKCKIEKGTKVTDWSPHPEDIENEVDSLSTTVTSNSASITVLQNQITSKVDNSTYTTDKATMQQQISSNTSLIEQNADEIALRVTQSELSNAMDGIGGRNLLTKANFHGSGYTPTYDGYTLTYNRGDGNQYAGMFFQANEIPLELNANYIFSFRFRKLSGTMEKIGGHRDSGFEITSCKIDGISISDWATGYTGSIIDDGNYHEIIIKFKATIIGDNKLYVQPNRGSTTPVNTEIIEWQLEKGTAKTQWQPSPDDIETQITNAETAITQNANEIALRATKTEMSNAIDNAVDGIIVGGGNLVDGTSSEWSDWKTPDDKLNNTFTLGYAYLPDDKARGDKFTCQVDIEVSGVTASGTGDWRFYSQGSVDDVWTITNIWRNDGSLGIGFNFDNTPPADGIYHFEWTSTLSNDAMVTASKFICGVRCDYWGSGKFRWRNLKVEKGTKATDWTPSNQDIASDIDNLGTRVTQAETSITQNANEIALRATKTEMTTAINNIYIGGRNLVRDSKMDKDTDFWSMDMTHCSVSYSKGYAEIIRTDTAYTSRAFHSQDTGTNKLLFPDEISNKTYTLSCDLKAVDGVALTGNSSIFWRVYYGDGTVFEELTLAIPTDLSSTEWRRCYVTKTFPERAWTGTTQYTIALAQSSNGICVKNMMLERASKPSQWSPAPEDAEQSISKVEAELVVQADQIASKVTQSQVNTYVETALDNLQIGGTNLYGFNKGITYSGVSGNATTITVDESIKGYVITANSEITALSQILARMQNLGFNGAGQYTFSADIKASTNVSISLDICDKGNVGFAITTAYQKISTSQTVNNYCTAGNYNGFVDISNLTTIPSGTKIYVANVMVERGNKASDWSPAPEDVDNKISLVETKVNNNTSSITQNATDIALRVTKTELDYFSSYDNNIIRNGNFWNNYDQWVFQGTHTKSIGEDSEVKRYMKIQFPVAGNATDARFYMGGLHSITGQTYTVSFMAKADTSGTVLVTNVGGDATTTRPSYKEHSLTTNWQKFTYSYVNQTTGSLTFWIKQANTPIYIAQIKLENGNVDWGSRLSSAETKIAQNSNNITLAATKTELQTTVNNLQTGGRNLLVNTSKYTKDTPLTIETSKNDGYFLFKEMHTPQPIKKGESLVLQACTDAYWSNYHGYQNADSKQKVGIWLYWYNSYEEAKNAANTYKSAVNYLSSGNLTETGRRIWKITAPTNYNDEVYCCVRLNAYSDGTETVSHDVWNIMLERGTIASDWQAAPEDVSNTTSKSYVLDEYLNDVPEMVGNTFETVSLQGNTLHNLVLCTNRVGFYGSSNSYFTSAANSDGSGTVCTLVDGHTALTYFYARIDDANFKYKVKPNTTYTVKYELIVSSGSLSTACRLLRPNATDPMSSVSEQKTISKGTYVSTFTTVATYPTISDQVFYITLNGRGDLAAGTTIEIRNVAVYEGDWTTKATFPPYTIGMKSVGEDSDLVIRSTGKNILKLKEEPDNPNRVTGVYKDGVLTVTSTTEGTWSYAGYILQLKPNTVYTLSFDKNQISGTGSQIAVYDRRIRYYIAGNSTATTGGKIYFTVPANGQVYLLFYSTTSTSELGTVEYSNLQLEEGSIATSIEEYHDKVTTLPETVLRRIPNTDIYDEIKGNKLIRRVGVYHTDGTESGWYKNNGVEGDTEYIYFLNLGSLNITKSTNAYCDILQNKTTSGGSGGQGSYFNANNNYGVWYMNVNNSTMTASNTLATFKTWLASNPATILYELETPIEEEFPTPTIYGFKGGQVIMEELIQPIVEVTYPTNIASWLESVESATQSVENAASGMQASITDLQTRVTNAEIQIESDSIISTVLESQSFATITEDFATSSDIENMATKEDVETAVDGIDFASKIDERISEQISDDASALSQTYVTQSQMTQTKTDIDMNFSMVGGINLIRNSLGFNGVNDGNWVAGHPNLVKETEFVTQSWTNFTLGQWNQQLSDRYHYSQLGLKVGDWITYKIDLNSTGGTKTLSARITSYTDATGNTYISNVGNAVSAGSSGTSQMQYQIRADYPYIWFGVQNNSSATVTTNTTEQYRKAKVEFGKQSTEHQSYLYDESQYIICGYDPDADQYDLGSSIHLVGKDWDFMRLRQGFPTIVGETYCVSYYLKSVTGTTYTVIADETLTTLVSSPQTSTATNGYTFVTYNFTATSSTSYLRIIANANADAFYTGIMIHRGATPFGHTFARGEVYNTNINFDANGIKVHQLDANGNSVGFTIMSPDEFAGYYDTDGDGSFEKIFYLNQDAVVSKRSVATTEIIMGKLKFINMDDDTYKGWALVPSTTNDWAITEGEDA